MNDRRDQPIATAKDSAASLTPGEPDDLRLELTAEERSQSVDVTFVPSRPDALVDPSLSSLPRLLLDDGREPAPELALEGVLGQGGRGDVRLAMQLSLRRRVAVKSLRGPVDPAATQELLREARIAGTLEHPNIVPVYALGRDPAERVLLVMRKVDGVPWGRLLREERALRTDAQLERHLEIFRQVCHAVEFAHGQGIVHRDLKPDNVMIGAFGEVVVLDWGLAASLAGDPARDLPPVSTLQGLAGTPSYMAPELVTADGRAVGRWTDVYLLGATLHELLTGAPPHRGGTLMEVLERAHRSAPQAYPPHVPAELAAVCQQAMARDPARRHPSVAALREAVQAWARHRQSIALADEAQRKLAQLDTGDPLMGPQPHATLAQARFGFEQALKSWPQNPVAAAGARRAQEVEVELELAHGNVAGAERALAALADPPQALVARLDELRAELAASRAELEKLRERDRELDLEATRTPRNLLLLFLGVVWGAVPLAVGLMVRAGQWVVTGRTLTWGWLGFAATVALATVVARRELLQNRIGRRFIGALVVTTLAALAVRAGAWLMGVAPEHAIGFEMIAYGVSAGVMAAMGDARFTWAAVAYCLAGVAIGWRADLAWFLAAAANPLAMIPTGLFWNRFERFGNPDLNQRVPLSPGSGRGTG